MLPSSPHHSKHLRVGGSAQPPRVPLPKSCLRPAHLYLHQRLQTTDGRWQVRQQYPISPHLPLRRRHSLTTEPPPYSIVDFQMDTSTLPVQHLQPQVSENQPLQSLQAGTEKGIQVGPLLRALPSILATLSMKKEGRTLMLKMLFLMAQYLLQMRNANGQKTTLLSMLSPQSKEKGNISIQWLTLAFGVLQVMNPSFRSPA